MIEAHIPDHIREELLDEPLPAEKGAWDTPAMLTVPIKGKREAKPLWPAPPAELKRLLAEGMTDEQIAGRYGVDQAQVRARLEMFGITRKSATAQEVTEVEQPKRTWPATEHELRELAEQGLTAKKIAALYGKPTNTVRTRLHRLGIEYRKERERGRTTKRKTTKTEVREVASRVVDEAVKESGSIADARVTVEIPPRPKPPAVIVRLPQMEINALGRILANLASVEDALKEAGVDVQVSLTVGGDVA